MAKTTTADIMVWTWAGWEPLQFYRRLGGFHEAQEGNALWADDWGRQLRSPQTAKALADAGINWVTTHFYKGFGLEAEATEMAETADMVRVFHRHGVKVFAYVQYGTIMPETLPAETDAQFPGRMDWNGQHDGHPYEYGDQYWRRKPCANQPGFREYLLRVADAAITTGVDGIWIDNLNADGCHCPDCQTAFRAYLRRTVADPWADLGLRAADLERVTIPRAERPRDPLFQRWIRWRCTEVHESLELLCRHARQRRPGIVMAANIGIGNHQRHILDNANWFAMLSLLDWTYAENGLFPAWRDGRIVTQHYPMGIAAAAGTKVVPGSGVGRGSRLHARTAIPDARQLQRCFAESAMLGGHAYGGPWGLRGENGGEAPVLLRDAAYRATNRRLATWYGTHRELFAASADAASVGLWVGLESMLGDEPAYRRASDAMAQLLLQNQIPFRYVLSDGFDANADLAVVVLPQVLPLSDAQAASLRAFVARGGRILATGRTSLYDEWMRQRRDYALADLFGVSFANVFEDAHHDAIVRNPQTGCVLLPGSWGLALADGTPACRVPGDRIVAELRGMLPADEPRVLSPLPHVGVSWRRLRGGGRLLSLLNYADAPVAGIAVTLAGLTQARERKLRAFSTAAPALPLRVVHPSAESAQLLLPPLDVEMFLVF